MHGLIFFYLHKFADVAAVGATSWQGLRANVTTSATKYLPSGVYPDADAVKLLASIAEAAGRPLPVVLEQFGRFLAPHLIHVAGAAVDPSWRTLDLIEHTEEIIHTMIRNTNPGAAPPVLEAVRQSPDELHVVYSSARRLCPLATGLIRGVAAHYGETVTIEEPSCMLRGDPFCTFVIENVATETHEPATPLTETLVFTPSASQPSTARRPGRTSDSIGPTTAFVDDTTPDGVPAAIGGYRVLQVIGRGAMGQVYKAHDDTLDRHVAIKVMHPSRANDLSARRRFVRESRAAAAVEHPHVVTIHQVGELPASREGQGLPFIVMQCLQGDTLGAYRANMVHVPLRDALRIGREIAEGLWAAHSRGLVHRDIKPENIFLEGPDLQVKIIDFGLARDIGDDPSVVQLTTDGAVVGTPAYMSPERIGSQAIDARSDIFGLGVILYELLANRLPFEGASMMAMLAAISRGTPSALSSVNPAVPADVSDLVMRLIAHDPAERPATAKAVAEQIAAIERRLAAG